VAHQEIELPNPEELEEQKSKHFTRNTALVTAVYAVLLAIVSLGGNNASKELSLSQQQASDQWAFYQSKALREHLYHIEGLRVEADLAERGPSLTPEARQRREAFLAEMKKQESRYEGEKQKIEEKARDLEHERDLFQKKDPYFDFGEVLLQISIVLASMSILTGARPIFWASLVAAVLGSALGLNGYLLLVALPFL
jgi:hypothetical protein